MFREEGEMDSHFWKCFWVILLNSSFGLFLLRIMGTSLFFYKEDNPMSSMNSVFSEGVIAEILLTLFEMDRHTVEILG